MILTCPECASRYFVDDARIGPEGRKVRCASCGAAWRESAPPAATTIGEPLSFAPPAEVAAFDEAPVKLRGARADVSSRLREEAAEKRKTREAAAVGATWAVMAAGFCALALIAVIFKTDVVRILPMTAGAYAFARMPVNPIGLAIDGVVGGPGLKDGRAALKVTGMERNVDTRPRQAEPLRVSLVDKTGHRIVSQVTRLPVGLIQPGETRPFTALFFDPPMQAASAQAEFAFDAMKPAARPATRPMNRHVTMAASSAPALPSAALKLRGAADATATPIAAPVVAKEAAPLPASSPYALPKSATLTHG